MNHSTGIELLDALNRHAVERPDAVVVRDTSAAPARSLSFRELHERVRDVAQRLINAVGRGAVVMLCSHNAPEFHAAFFGALAAGCTIFPFSPDAAEPELIAAARASGAAALIGTQRVIESLDGHVKIAWWIDDLSAGGSGFGVQDSGKPGAPELNPEPRTLSLRNPDSSGLNPPPAGAGPALLLQTSGTTGRPGIVRRSAAAVDAVARNMMEAIGFGSADRVLSTLPLCHSYGLEHGLLAPILAGSTVCLCRSFNLASVIEVLQKEQITLFPGVPSIFEMIGRLAHDDAAFGQLRCAYSAGSVLPLAVAEMVRQRFGIKIGQVYGTTEVGSVTFNDPNAADYDPTSAGAPMRGVKIRADAMNGGAEGQIHVSAPSLFSGYIHGDGSEISEGFFATGDLGQISAQGHLNITGRLKLMIDVGGLKVNPTEVELAMLEHPGVAECVVVPMPLTETINRLKALVIPRCPDDPPADDELARFARARLAAYKVPRRFEVHYSLPRTSTGKILRHLIES